MLVNIGCCKHLVNNVLGKEDIFVDLLQDYMKITSNFSSSEIRNRIQSNWQEYLSKYGNLFTSDSINGSSPPSVFVGSYGYPKVGIGPMLPPVHGAVSYTHLRAHET